MVCQRLERQWEEGSDRCEQAGAALQDRLLWGPGMDDDKETVGRGAHGQMA